MSNPFIYIRGLRHVDHTVFSVNDGQKFYYDPQFGHKMAYSSGQQVKRSILEALDLPFAAITFNWEIDKKKGKEGKAKEKEAHSTCDPSYTDQLIGGYMRAESGSLTVKRRSPLSISAMRPLHPLLGGIESPTENISFDRTSHPEHHKVNVYWSGKEKVKLTDEELDDWLTSHQRSLPSRKFIQDQTRASGLFVYDIAIDLRRLFSVSTNKLEPELSPEILEKLQNDGWKESRNIFGKCLVCPAKIRQKITTRLADAIINWRITSNQSRTFSLMEVVAVAIGNDANQIAYSIRGELRQDTERPKANPVIDETTRTNIFVTPVASSFIPGAVGGVEALDKAKELLIAKMNEFDYENQIHEDK